MNVSVVSYRRPEQCAAKTLSTLARQAPGARVRVFLSDYAGEYNAYEQAIVDRSDALSPITVTLERGEPTLTANRRAAYRGSPEGWVLFMDDDVESVVRAHGPKDAEETPLKSVYREGCGAANQLGLRLVGLYPVCNPFFMKQRVLSGLRFVLGSAFFEKVDHEDERCLTRPDLTGTRDDIERTLLHYEIHGGNVRVENVAAKTKYMGNAGGQEEFRVGDGSECPEDKRSLAHIRERWPNLTQLTVRKDGRTEVKLLEPKA